MRKQVEKFNGRFCLQSEPGKGTRLELKIPLHGSIAQEGFDHPSFHTPFHIDKFSRQPETIKPQTDSPKPITHPANTSTLAYVKAAAAGLSAEEKAELRKWLGN